MGYLLYSRLRSNSFTMVNIAVHLIWKDGFMHCVCLRFGSRCGSCRPRSQVSFKERVPERERRTIPSDFGEDLHSTGLVPDEKLFQAFPH